MFKKAKLKTLKSYYVNPTDYTSFPLDTVLVQRLIRNKSDYKNIFIKGEQNTDPNYKNFFLEKNFWFTDNTGHSFFVPKAQRIFFKIEKQNSTGTGIYKRKTTGTFLKAFIRHQSKRIQTHYFIFPLGDKKKVSHFVEEYKKGNRLTNILTSSNEQVVVKDQETNTLAYASLLAASFQHGYLTKTSAATAILVRNLSQYKIRISIARIDNKKKGLFYFFKRKLAD